MLLLLLFTSKEMRKPVNRPFAAVLFVLLLLAMLVGADLLRDWWARRKVAALPEGTAPTPGQCSMTLKQADTGTIELIVANTLMTKGGALVTTTVLPDGKKQSVYTFPVAMADTVKALASQHGWVYQIRCA